MDGAEEYKPVTVSSLATILQQFIRDNESSGGLHNRWLADVARPFYAVVYAVVYSHLSEKDEKDINAFRAAEIEKELERKRKDIDALERDLKKVREAA